MSTKPSIPTLCQIIENMEIGGAQRTASGLMKLPGVEVDLVTYGQLSEVSNRNYDAVLLHVWPASRDQPNMNWPRILDFLCKQIVVFNHDWRGLLNIKADKYIVYSQFAASASEADGAVYIIPPGIPTEQYVNLKPRENGDSVTVGRLSTMHRGKISIETIGFWNTLPADRFIIGGDGPQRSILQETFGQDSRFLFPGMIPPRQVPEFLNQIDIFLYDTVWHVESFCYVIIEAMAAGCVVVAKDKGAINELVQHGQNGFLYNSNREAFLICQKLIADPAIRKQISLEAQNFAHSYSLDRFYLSILTVLGWQS